MIDLKGKLIAGGVIASLAFGAGWTINGWRHEASRVEAVEAAVKAYREKLEKAEALAEVDTKADTALSGLLEDIRRERDIALEELAARPTLTRTITKVLPDATPCTCDALGADFRLRWNDPTAGRPADPVPPATD